VSFEVTPERFLRLKRAGMHQLSLSIDFPDKRHDEFRRIPGLFERMDQVVPECVKIGDEGDVSINCCITAWNYPSLPDVVRLADRWGVQVNFSSYSPLRVDEPGGLAQQNGTKEGLRKAIEEVIDLKKRGSAVYTSEEALWKFYDFLCSGHTGGCRAGERFLVVNPDARLAPWSWRISTTNARCCGNSRVRTSAARVISALVPMPRRPPARCLQPTSPS
jgi:MoaA/NifB/PqqE/SkfB family radical SAM enzyme